MVKKAHPPYLIGVFASGILMFDWVKKVEDERIVSLQARDRYESIGDFNQFSV